MTDKSNNELLGRPPARGSLDLRWTGKRPYRNEQYYPSQRKERYGEEHKGWINRIFWGDNLQVMAHLQKEFRGKIDLIYIDPPFDSKADYKKRIELRGQAVVNDSSVFEEKQYGDIWTNGDYLQFMYERLTLMRELMSDKGSIYVHCDWHKSHYLRLILDEIFGNDNFRNEIIWKRGNHKKADKIFAWEHDTLFFYTKSERYVFNPIYTEYTKEYLDKYYDNVDEDGRRYQVQGMYGKGSGPPMRFGDRIISPPAGLHWRWEQKNIDEAMASGVIVFPRDGKGMPRFKDYLDEKKGVPVRTIWNDLSEVNSQAIERENYPTQKPEVLIERIVEASSNPGDLIFDCFMGSGTTQAVAMKSGRRFIGADINLGAIQTTTKRLISVANEIKADASQKKLEDNSEEKKKDMYTGFEVYNVNNYDFFRFPDQAKDLLIEALGIQKFSGSDIWDGELDGRMVVIMPVDRIATKADLERIKANLPYKIYEKRKEEAPSRPVESITIICMGHEPDLKASLEAGASGYKLDVQVVDILRDKTNLQFKREAEADIAIEGNRLVIRSFYPLNLMQKLSWQRESVEDWRQLVDSIIIDWNYDGAVMNPSPSDIDIPDSNKMVKGIYDIPVDAGTIRVKITDLLSESLELEVRKW